MTVWVLQQALTPEEEARIRERDELTLHFEGLPDLSRVSTPAHARQLLKALHPQDPPETISRKFDAFWDRYSTLAREDILVVPLKSLQEVALAEVIDRYRYRVGDSGNDVHMVGVKWYDVRVPMTKLRKHKDILASAQPMSEITGRDARRAIYDQLPHSYNRFVKWKWLLVVFFLMSLVRLFVRVTHQH